MLMHLSSDLLEDKCIDNVISNVFWFFQVHKTSRFHVAVHLFSNRSQRRSKCGENISDTSAISFGTFLFLPHFDFICDLLLNRHTATWNLFVKYITEDIN